jgi:hypothetical protein
LLPGLAPSSCRCQASPKVRPHLLIYTHRRASTTASTTPAIMATTFASTPRDSSAPQMPMASPEQVSARTLRNRKKRALKLRSKHRKRADEEARKLDEEAEADEEARRLDDEADEEAGSISPPNASLIDLLDSGASAIAAARSRIASLTRGASPRKSLKVGANSSPATAPRRPMGNELPQSQHHAIAPKAALGNRGADPPSPRHATVGSLPGAHPTPTGRPLLMGRDFKGRASSIGSTYSVMV